LKWKGSSGWFCYAPLSLLEDRFYLGYFWFISLLLCFFVVLCLLYEAKKKWLGGSWPRCQLQGRKSHKERELRAAAERIGSTSCLCRGDGQP